MISLNEFIEQQGHNSFFALVTFDGHTEPTYFCSVDLGEKGLLDLHSPCEVFKRAEGKEAIEDYLSNLTDEENGGFSDSDIDEYFRPLIVDDIYYEVENFQCAQYLPDEVDDIKICTERDCLLFALNDTQSK